jgi:hypothetical protein
MLSDCAWCLFRSDELTFKKGDIIYLETHADAENGWLYGSLDIFSKSKGLFPSNHVQRLPWLEAGADDGSSCGASRRFEVIFNFSPTEEDELKLSVKSSPHTPDYDTASGSSSGVVIMLRQTGTQLFVLY